MLWPARDIWDTRIQCICGILSARGEAGPEIYLTATFAQVTLDPPRIAINPNRIYPIESAVRSSKRFAINVMPASSRDLVLRLIRIPRREPRKPERLGLRMNEDHHGIPFLEGSLQTVFCEVESTHDTGDHTLIIGRVLESRLHSGASGQRPLFYREVAGRPARFPRLESLGRTLLNVTGALDLLKRRYYRRRPPPPADVAKTTYLEGGQTDEEIEQILRHGTYNLGRRLSPPAAPAILKRSVGVCVVGSGWGSFHCELLRKANPEVRLFVCGRSPDRTAKLAQAVGAEAIFLSMEEAVADQRVRALSFALPHDLHRRAVELAAAAGKHTLVEKPIATTLEDADAMIEAAHRAKICFMVAENMHFRPAIHEAVRAIRAGDIGEPLYLLAHAGGIRRPSGWAADKNRMGGGVLMDIGVHYVHGLRMLFGEPDRVIASRAMQVNTKLEAEDSVQMILSSRYGWEAHLLLSWASQRGSLPDFVVLGSGGTLYLWPHKHHLDYYPVAPLPLTRFLSFVRPYWLQEKLMRPELQRVHISLRQAEPTGYLWEMREFLAAIIEERAPALPPQEARRDLEIVLRGYEALEGGRPAEIP